MAEEDGSRWSEAARPSSGSGAEVDTGPQTETSQDARNMAMLCHLLGVVGFFAPLVIWLIERDKHRFVDEHGRQAMNYQISVLIYGAVCWLLCLVQVKLVVLLWLLTVVHLVLVVVGTVQASQGRLWRYPIAIPFLKHTQSR